MLSIQIDRAPQGGHFSAMNGKNNTTAVVLFLPQGLQLVNIYYVLLEAVSLLLIYNDSVRYLLNITDQLFSVVT